MTAHDVHLIEGELCAVIVLLWLILVLVALK